MTLTDAWRKFEILFDGEPFSIMKKIMHGGSTGYPLQWVEVDYKGNIYSAETFEEVLEQIKVKHD